MHELSIAMEIIDIIQQETIKRKLKSISEVGVSIGAISGIDPEALSFSFEAAAINSPLAKTKLVIEQVPVKGRCRLCGKYMQIDDFIFLCPHCDSTDIDITQGEEINLQYLVEA